MKRLYDQRIALHEGIRLALNESMADVGQRQEVTDNVWRQLDILAIWLNVANFALGIFTLLALLLVFVAMGWDLLALKRRIAAGWAGSMKKGR